MKLFARKKKKNQKLPAYVESPPNNQPQADAFGVDLIAKSDEDINKNPDEDLNDEYLNKDINKDINKNLNKDLEVELLEVELNEELDKKTDEKLNMEENKAENPTEPSESPEEGPSEPPPPPIDAKVKAEIAIGSLLAFIYIEPPSNGGAVPDLNSLKKALEEKGIKHNIDYAKLEALANKPLYNSKLLIARGTPPENGVDGTAEFLIETEEKTFKPKDIGNGKIDFYDLGIVENVKKGQVLCKITLPTEGLPGISVLGRELKQKTGQAVPSYLGQNTELSQDGTKILSQIDGQVEFIGQKIHVKETFYIQGNIDVSTGNIKVEKNLVVQGMVMPGFKIEAGGNIDIRGTVENAAIISGGNVQLQGGITGSELSCEGDLKSHYIENCSILVKGDITAEYILNSQIKCGRNLKTIGMISRIIGGSCIVGKDIEARTIGSDANVKTRLELGTDSDILERQEELKVLIPKYEKQIETLKPLVTLFNQLNEAGRLPPEKQETMESVNYSYNTTKNLLAEAKTEFKKILKDIHDKGYGQIICSETIYPGTKIIMGSSKLLISDIMHNARIFFKEGSIMQGSAR